MWKKKLCLAVSDSFRISISEQIEKIACAGFDGFFAVWYPGCPMEQWTAQAEKSHVIFQSLHAPFGKAADLWGADTARADAACAELLACLADCARWRVPILVVHAFIGFEEHTPTASGLIQFDKLVAAAEGCGVKIAFENTEGEEYLDALMAHFAARSAVGFCWDSGHEMCYNHHRDLLADYGGRLLSTHLNDNLGVKDFAGSITWHDDLHLLPFDGIADWDAIAVRLQKSTMPEFLTFELTRDSKPGRHDNDGYAHISLEEYLALAYQRACRVAAKLMRVNAGL